MAGMAGTLPANEVEQSAVQAWFVETAFALVSTGFAIKAKAAIVRSYPAMQRIDKLRVPFESTLGRSAEGGKRGTKGSPGLQEK